MRRMTLTLAVLMLGGCSGEYILTAPDVATLSGQDAPVVVRLQRREVWRYAPPQGSAAIIFRLGEETPQCARTDKDGYTAVSIKTPAPLGRYEITLYHQDINGDEVTSHAAIYVFDPDKPVAVVDADSLPRSGKLTGQASAAIVRMQLSVQLIYVSHKYASQPARAHAMFDKYGYPNGPVVPYSGLKRWWKWRQSDTGALDELQRRFPKLRWGVTADAATAKAFAQAGLDVMFVGKKEVADAERFDTWADVRVDSTNK